MRKFPGIVIAVLCTVLALPLLAGADDEQVPTEKEIAQAEGIPPVIPHAPPSLKGGSEDAACLTCHEEGKKGAPQTPHAERRGCTQCHVQGEIQAKPKKKGKK